MPQVRGNVRTWGLDAFSADELLIVRFTPSSAGTTGTATVYPLRPEEVSPEADGTLVVDLAQTTNTRQDVFFRVVFEWFIRDRNGQWVTKGRSEIPGELRVPAAGGNLATLLSVKPRPGAILYGLGAPPTSLRGVQYVDITGPKLRYYAPKGTRI